MADVLLVNARCEKYSRGRRRGRASQYSRIEHLGLGYLASTLRSHGWSAEIIDAQFHELSAEEVAARVLANHSLAVGFTAFLNNMRESVRVISLLRKAGDSRHVTLGGHHATFNHEEILDKLPGVDSVVLGEGEQTLVELTTRLASGADWHDVPGLAVRGRAGRVVANASRPLIQSLDSLPFPVRDPYEDQIRKHGIATVLSSRGCYGRCSFCSVRAFYDLSEGKPWRARGPANVVDEIEDLKRRLGVTHVEFADDNLVGPGRIGRERAYALGEEMLRRGLGVTFFFICRANDVDEDLLAFLKRAGLSGVDVGLESWVPRHLDIYNKQVTAEGNRRAVATLKKLGLAKRFYLIPSNPYGRIDELQRNLAEAKKVGLRYFPDSAFFNRLTVFKGSPIEKKIRKDGLLKSRAGRNGFIGVLDYDFIEPAMAQAAPIGEAIFNGYKELADTIQGSFAGPESHDLEKEFGSELNRALLEAAVEIFQAILADFRRRRSTHAPPDVSGRLEALRQEVAAVVALHDRGRFDSFADLELVVGGRRLRYPPDTLRSFAEKLAHSA